MNNKDILKEMTLEEKASLCSGKDFWTTKAVDRLGIPSIMMTDGPHGLRKQSEESDHVGLNTSVAATCFPAACTTASSWDINLLNKMGVALAEECLQEQVSVILGPGANIKRSPLCGRNFEYFSEDPYLSGSMAAAMINGVQSKGIGTSLKHYVLNNQEQRRMTIDAVVDERAQREIYLAGFETAVKNAQPWTVMCSYNRVDGTYLSDHKRLLTDILKDEWGHTGLVVTDWGACNDRVQGIKSGLELEMPSSNGKNDKKIVNAVKSGQLTEKELDKAVIRLIDLALKANANLKENYKYDVEEHRQLAQKIASESMVLLKNEGILPIATNKKIAVIGEFAKNPRYQGAGSSQINPHQVDNACDVLDAMKVNYRFAQGYKIGSAKPVDSLINEAISVSKDADVVLIFAGLTPEFESEGFDREHMSLPESHNKLIKEISNVNKNVVVVLQNGSPVEMPWINDVKGILESYLGGEAGAGAILDILFGNINPSGKLAETFPIRLSDNSSYNYFPGHQKTVEYRESIYVGYRYYDKAEKEVLFPFGFGLSYTQFEYSDLAVKEINEFQYKVSLKVKNTGKVKGSEIVQLYVRNNDSKIFKAEKELRAFDKVALEPNEEKEIEFVLDKRAFAYFNTQISDWHVDSGIYGILIGASSVDIRLKKDIKIESTNQVETPDMNDKLPNYYQLSNDVFAINDQQFEILLGRKLPPIERDANAPIDLTTPLGDIQDKLIGKLLVNMIKKNITKMAPDSKEGEVNPIAIMLERMVMEMPIRAFGMLGGDSMPKYLSEGLVLMLNGKFLKGLRQLMKK